MELIRYINRDRTQLFYQKYKYNLKVTNKNGSKLYGCPKCKTTITIQEDKVLREGKHMHEPATNVEIDICIRTRRLKEACEENKGLDVKVEYQNIYRDLSVKHGDMAVGYFWKDWEHVRTSYMYHSEPEPKRFQITDNEGNPQELDVTKIMLANKEMFLRYDNKSKSNRILIFMSNRVNK